MKAFVALTAALFATAAASAADGPRWTAAEANQQIVQWQPVWYVSPSGSRITVTAARCSGRGTPVGGQYRWFLCQTTFSPSSLREPPVTLRLHVKVRQSGTGQPCVSPAGWKSVPAACMAVTGSRVVGSVRDAERELTSHMRDQDRSWAGQGLACRGFGAGFYRCSWSDGRATVVFRPAGVTVTVL